MHNVAPQTNTEQNQPHIFEPLDRGNGLYVGSTHALYFPQDPFVNGPNTHVDPEATLSREELAPRLEPAVVGEGLYRTNRLDVSTGRHSTDALWTIGENREMPTLGRIEPHVVAMDAIKQTGSRTGPRHTTGRIYYSGRHAQR